MRPSMRFVVSRARACPERHTAMPNAQGYLVVSTAPGPIYPESRLRLRATTLPFFDLGIDHVHKAPLHQIEVEVLAVFYVLHGS